jgi:hypothetical protein
VENDKKFESVYSTKVRAGKRRTYFFDVRQTKGDDYYITITESTKRFDGNGYERHKIFLYKEDFNRFLGNLNDTIEHVKTELMPDFDYELYERRQAEWEEKLASGEITREDYSSTKAEATASKATNEPSTETTTESTTSAQEPKEDADEDLSW